MAYNPITGKDLRVLRKTSATDNAPVYMGTITTSNTTETFDFDDSTVANTDTPGALPNRSSVPKMYAWSQSVSGLFDPVEFAALRAAARQGQPLYLQIVIARTKANGGGRWDGAVWFENIQHSYDSLGVVKFSAQMRGEGDLVWTQAAV